MNLSSTSPQAIRFFLKIAINMSTKFLAKLIYGKGHHIYAEATGRTFFILPQNGIPPADTISRAKSLFEIV